MPVRILPRPRGRHHAITEATSSGPIVAQSPRTGIKVQRSGFVYDVPPQGLDENQVGVGTATQTDRKSLMQELWEAYIACPWAWVSVQAIARTVTAGGLVTEWVGDDEEGDQDIPDKPPAVLALEALLKFVNPTQNIRQLCRNAIADLLVFGDCYLELTWVGGRVVALWNQDSPTTTPLADDHGNVTGYVQVTDYGDKVEFKPREMIHISLDAARPGVLGVSPMQAALHPVMCWLFAMGTGKESFKRGLPPNIHVDHPAGMKDTEVRTWRDKYFTRNTGPKNIGAPIQTKGGAKVTELQTGKITDVKMGKDQARDEILSIFGVPPAEAGVIESGNLGGGTGDSQHRTFEINTCGPIGELVTEALTYTLAVVAFGITDWKLKWGEVDYRDSVAVEQIRSNRLRDGAWTLNKYRAAIGEPPVPGGDDAVLVDRQNLVLWADMASLSKASVASKGAPAVTAGEEPPNGEPEQVDDQQQDNGQPPPGVAGNGQAKPKATESLRSRQVAAFQTQFQRALSAMPEVTETAQTVAGDVYELLAKNFPPKAITWVHDADWSGPRPVDVRDVDTNNWSKWAASHDDQRVAKARRKLLKSARRGKHPKPLVLIRTPGEDKLVIADGHHRYIAATKEDQDTVWAYVGKVDKKTGKWDEMHSSQIGGND